MVEWMRKSKQSKKKQWNLCAVFVFTLSLSLSLSLSPFYVFYICVCVHYVAWPNNNDCIMTIIELRMCELCDSGFNWPITKWTDQTVSVFNRVLKTKRMFLCTCKKGAIYDASSISIDMFRAWVLLSINWLILLLLSMPIDTLILLLL